jgi:phosphate transport system substrate-binding protein
MFTKSTAILTARAVRSMLPAMLVALAGLVGVVNAAEPSSTDDKLAHYKPSSGISGSINSIGSDTLLNMMTLWQESFSKVYPSVRTMVEGKGSSTAPPALIEGTAQLGPMSRSMKPEEVDKFEAKYGFKPTEIKVAIDALAVFVNKDNPVEGMTLEQVDAVFSRTRARGYSQDIATWGQLGLTGPWANRPLSLYGRNSASGTYGFFKEHALKKGDYKDTVKEQPGSAAVVNGVTEDPAGVGYSGIGYKTSGVRVVPLAAKEGEPFYPAEEKEVMSGKYPLGRFLFIYVAKAPGKPLDPVVKEFITYILSAEGQEVVVKDGYLPLNQQLVAKELEKLD